MKWTCLILYHIMGLTKLVTLPSQSKQWIETIGRGERQGLDSGIGGGKSPASHSLLPTGQQSWAAVYEDITSVEEQNTPGGTEDNRAKSREKEPNWWGLAQLHHLLTWDLERDASLLHASASSRVGVRMTELPSVWGLALGFVSTLGDESVA